MRLTGQSIGYGCVAYGAAAIFQLASANAVATETTSGGWKFPTPKVKTADDVRRERIRLGIIPAPVEKVVEKAARKVIAKAQKAAHEAQSSGVDAIAYLQAHHAQQSAILAADLRKRQIEASLDDQRTYMILLSIEVQKVMLQDREDEQILALLMEM